MCVFKHALVQETAYQSLLRSTRQQYHQQTAHILEQRFPEIAGTQPELLAHHFTEGALPAQALPYWQQAGQHAVERSANSEAVSHFTRGLELLKALPATPERIQQELTLHLAMGSPLLMLKGHTAPEVEHTYSRALQLCQRAVDSPQRFSALVGLWRFNVSKASLRTAHELAKQCFTLAERLQLPALLQEAHLMLGSTLFYLGELAQARVHLEKAIALSHPQQSHFLTLSGGTHPGVTSLSYLSWTLWMLGYPNQALTRSHEALTLAEELSHAYSLGFALHFASMLHIWRREVQLVREKSDAVIALASEQGFVRWLGGGRLRRGWALAEQGRAQEGIAELCHGLATWQAMGGELGLPNILAQLAEAYNKGGRVEEGLLVLAKAMTVVNKNEERYYEAGLNRLKGELLLQRVIPDQQQAEAHFHRALNVAHRQGAKSLELRAMVSLSRLWRRQGKRAEAHQMLSATYGWFTEGFDTADLQEANTLLAELM
jgi:predicted ATPase